MMAAADPRQATAYMIGTLEIRPLRDEAIAKRDAKFVRRRFHDLPLEDRALPLWAVGRRVERWLARQRTYSND